MIPLSRRHILLAAAAAAVVALPVKAEQATVPRIGWLGLGRLGAPSAFFDNLRAGLNDLGYVDGETIAIEARWVESAREQERLAVFVDQLRAAGVSAIVTQGPLTPLVGNMVKDVPVVFGYSGDPVLAKFADSLARPGRNMTGVSFMSLEVNGKRLQLLKEAAPSISRVAIMSFPEHPGEALELEESGRAAAALGISLSYHLVRSPADFDTAFETIAAADSQAIVALPNALIMQERARIIGFAMRRGISAVSGWSDFARSGGLFTYGPNLSRSFRRLAHFVDEILRGESPAEIPIERPTEFELVVNLATAKTLGLQLPPSLIARADEVID